MSHLRSLPTHTKGRLDSGSCFQSGAAPGPTCEGRRQAVEAVWLLLLSAHLSAVRLVLAQDGTVLVQAPQSLEGLELVPQHGL